MHVYVTSICMCEVKNSDLKYEINVVCSYQDIKFQKENKKRLALNI